VLQTRLLWTLPTAHPGAFTPTPRRSLVRSGLVVTPPHRPQCDELHSALFCDVNVVHYPTPPWLSSYGPQHGLLEPPIICHDPADSAVGMQALHCCRPKSANYVLLACTGSWHCTRNANPLLTLPCRCQLYSFVFLEMAFLYCHCTRNVLSRKMHLQC
jgi:hypothetical protein